MNNPTLHSRLIILLLVSIFSARSFSFGEAYVPTNQQQILVKAVQSPREDIAIINHGQANVLPYQLAEKVHQYLSMSSESGDERYVGYAEALLANFQQADDPDILLAKAAVLQRKHQFNSARELVEKVIQQYPANTYAYSMAAFIEIAQGNAAKAKHYCEYLYELQSYVMGLNCSVNANSLTGDLDSGYEMLRVILERNQLDEDEQIEVLITLADVAAQKGIFSESEVYFKKALALKKHNHFVVKKLADLYLKSNRLQDCIDLTQQYTANMELALRSAVAKKRLDQAVSQQELDSLHLYFEEQRLRNPTEVSLEAGIYQLEILNQANVALETTIKNWQNQRGVEDIYWLVRSAVAADNSDVIAEKTQWINQQGLYDFAIEEMLGKG